MKVVFEDKKIEVFKDGSKVKSILENELSTNSTNNLLFSLLELCANNSNNLEFELKDNATPFVKKLHEILTDEFLSMADEI